MPAEDFLKEYNRAALAVDCVDAAKLFKVNRRNSCGWGVNGKLQRLDELPKMSIIESSADP